MHVSGLINRGLDQVMSGAAGAQDAAAKLAAKKPTAKEIREEEKRSREKEGQGTRLGISYYYC